MKNKKRKNKSLNKLTARQKEQQKQRQTLVAEKQRRDRLFRDRELYVLHNIEIAIRQLIHLAAKMDREMTLVAATIAPLVHDLRNGNAELLMTAEAAQAKEYYRNGH